MNDELNPAPLANGHAEGLGPVPVMETIPVAPKKRRKRKAKPAAPKAARVPKTPRIDPLLAEDQASKASSTNSPVAMVAAPIEEAPAPTLLTGVGADHFREARERSERRMFDENAPVRIAPPLKSSWWDRFVFGFRHMTGFDSSDNSEPFTLGVALKTFLVACVIVSGAGVYMAWF